MRILVCGGRDFRDWDLLQRTLDSYKDDVTAIIHGCALGADTLADSWARSRNLGKMWREHGKSGGPIRNYRMLNEGKPDLVIAFPGGKGTAHMVRIAKRADVKVIEVRDDTNSNDAKNNRDSATGLENH